jgi:hypothetical protein
MGVAYPVINPSRSVCPSCIHKHLREWAGKMPTPQEFQVIQHHFALLTGGQDAHPTRISDYSAGKMPTPQEFQVIQLLFLREQSYGHDFRHNFVQSLRER